MRWRWRKSFFGSMFNCFYGTLKIDDDKFVWPDETSQRVREKKMLGTPYI
jgi:hypothetical protein